MKLGIFGMPLHPPHRPQAETYDEVQERIILADQLGFDEAFIGEHISTITEPVTSPLIFLATLIHRTKNIKLGTGVVALPNKHPAVVAGEVAMFDHLAKGRFLFGIGPGGLASDMELFGVLDGQVRNQKMAESIDIILDIWKSDPPYRYETEHYSFGIEQTVIPELSVGTMHKPFQHPHPPILSTAMSPFSGSVKTAVERGWAPMTANFCGENVVASHWQKYLEGCEAVGKEATGEEWRVARNVVVRKTDAEAEEAALDPQGGNYFYMDYLWKVLRAADYTAVMKSDPSQADEDVKVEDLMKEIVIYGSPETVAEKIAAMRERSGKFGGLLMALMDGEGSNDEGERTSMRLLAEEVMPKLRAL